MAEILSSLTKWVDEQRLPLISKLGVETRSAQEFTLQTGVKNEAALNLLSVDGTFADGRACGWADSGATTFSQRKLKVGSIKLQTAICQNAMQEYWMSYQVAVGANRKNLPFEEEIANKFVDYVNEEVEKGIWQGDTTGSTANLAFFDGLIKIVEGATDSTEITVGSGATIYDRVKAVYLGIPEAVLGKARIYMSYADFRSLVQELVTKNLYNYVTNQDDNMQIVLPGTNTVVKAMAGIPSGHILSLVPEHTFYGCDLADDKEDFRIWYSEDNDEYRVRIAFVAGVQIAFPSETCWMAW